MLFGVSSVVWLPRLVGADLSRHTLLVVTVSRAIVSRAIDSVGDMTHDMSNQLCLDTYCHPFASLRLPSRVTDFLFLFQVAGGVELE